MHYVALHHEQQERSFLRFIKVDIRGHEVALDGREMFDLAALDRNTNRVLPNGICMLPPIRKCEKGNACLSCGDFATDARYLDDHRRQLEQVRSHLGRWVEQQASLGRVIDEENVYYRNRQQEIASLEAIIASLERGAGEAVRGAGVAGRVNTEAAPRPVSLPTPRLRVT